MESLVMALRGLFLRRKPARMNREQTSGAPGGSPPLSGRIWCGGAKAALGFAPPPAGRASALAGDPSPWPAPAAFNIQRPGMAAARTAATLFFGGRCGGLLAVVGQAPAPYIVGGGARGGPPAGVGSDAIGSARCEHWPSQHVSAPAAGGLPLPGIQCPPLPPGGGDGGSITVRKGV